MSGVADWAVGLVLALWLAVTVVAAVTSLRRRVTYWDVARLIPNWALFVRPRTEDLVLLRRDLLADGTLTGWIEVEIAGLDIAEMGASGYPEFISHMAPEQVPAHSPPARPDGRSRPRAGRRVRHAAPATRPPS